MYLFFFVNDSQFIRSNLRCFIKKKINVLQIMIIPIIMSFSNEKSDVKRPTSN